MGFSNTPAAASSTAVIMVADPAAPGGGAGTWASPYTPAEARAAVVASTAPSIELWLKSGVHRQTYVFDTAKQRQVRVRAQLGKSVQVIPAINVTSGWTQHATLTNLWYRTHSWDWVAPSSAGSGGVFDVTAGQHCRHWVPTASSPGIAYDTPFRVYTRALGGTALATINASPMTSVVDQAAQRIYINASVGRVCVTTNASATVNMGTKCGITAASLNVTVANTFGIAPGQTVTGPGIPAGATVATITNVTTFVLAAGFAATVTNATAYLSIGPAAESTVGLTAGQAITGAGIQAGTTLLAIVDNNTLTLSLPATATTAVGAILGFSVDPNTRTYEIPQASFGLYYGAVTAGVPSGLPGVLDTDANMQELFLEGVEVRYALDICFGIDRVLLDARNCSAYGTINSHGWSISDSHGSVTACKSVSSFGDGFNNLGQAATIFPVPPVMTFTACEGNGGISGSSDGFSNHPGMAVVWQGCKAIGNCKNGFSPAADHVAIDCVGESNGNAGITPAAFISGIKSVIKNFRGSGNFAGILVQGGNTAPETMDTHIDRPVLCQNTRGIYIFNAQVPATITGQIIAPQYNQNTGFTIATIAQSAINVTSTFAVT
jgi:hypothetical protein